MSASVSKQPFKSSKMVAGGEKKHVSRSEGWSQNQQYVKAFHSGSHQETIKLGSMTVWIDILTERSSITATELHCFRRNNSCFHSGINCLEFCEFTKHVLFMHQFWRLFIQWSHGFSVTVASWCSAAFSGHYSFGSYCHHVAHWVGYWVDDTNLE